MISVSQPSQGPRGKVETSGAQTETPREERGKDREKGAGMFLCVFVFMFCLSVY